MPSIKNTETLGAESRISVSGAKGGVGMRNSLRRTRGRLTVILVAIVAVYSSACGPTARHPGPLGGFGDFLEDTPGAVFVLALIVWAISNNRERR